MKTNYIKSLKFSRKGNIQKGTDKIYFSLPSDGENTVTVICGRNRTGKSYLLRTIKRCFETYNKNMDIAEKSFSVQIDHNDVQIEVTEKNKPINYFLISNINDLLRYIKGISIERDTKFRQRGPRASRMFYDDPIRLKIAMEKFSEEALIYLNPNFDKPQWENNDKYRGEIVKATLKKNHYYKLNTKDSLVEFFLSATGGHLYIGWNFTLEKTNLVLYLYYDNDRIISFENWSEGQKVLFLCLVVTKYIMPDILIFDEVENHLHPEFISIALEYFKLTIKQTILTSHHPHILFSKYANSVWYLEVENQSADYPKVIVKKNKGTNVNIAPVRRCYELIKNYHKVEKVYGLFNNFDNNLIKLSASTLSDFNDYISDMFSGIYHYGITPSNPSKKMDLQVEGLLKHVVDKMERKGHIKILEIGSGKGRVLLDVAKLNSSKISELVSWTLFEPVDSVYKLLLKNISDLKSGTKLNYNINVTNTLGVDSNYDIIFFANILHELTPNVVSYYFERIQNLLKNDSEVIIIELYPLLTPEYFSVPYKQYEMEKMFRQLSWSVSSDRLNIKNAKVDAYWSVLRKKNKDIISQDEILSLIENFWKDEILLNRCADYGGRSEFKSAEDSILLMCELTTIASISSYFNKEWKLDVL